jgi:Ca-activated chloride channel family protein
MIGFAQPVYLLLLVVVVAMSFAVARFAAWQQRARVSFAGPQGSQWPAPSVWPRLGLVLLAAALVVIAAARPQWGERDSAREFSGVDFVIALDISQSMDATDVSPSRFDLAGQEIARLLEAMRGSRVGLVVFAGSAIFRSPLTTDIQAMSELVRRARLDASLVRAGSDLGAAMGQAGRVLENSESTGKAVILISDGEDHASTYQVAAPGLRNQGITIFTAGVGTTEGTTLLEQRAGPDEVKLDASGQPVVTRLNESTLRAIAEAGGGSYMRLGEGSGLAGLRDALSGLSQTSRVGEGQTVPIERFQPFIIAALVLLAESWLLPARFLLPAARRLGRAHPRSALAVLLVAFAVGACGSSDSLPGDNAAANELYAAGDFQGALAAYEALLAKRPDVPELSYNAGNALHRLGDYQRAVGESQRSLPPEDVELGGKAYYSLGNHYLALGNLEQAFDAYRSSLLLAPHDADAKHNLELTLLLLARAEPEPLGPGDGGSQGPGTQPHPGETPPGEAPPAEGEPSEVPAPTDSPPTEPGGSSAELMRELEEALAGIDEEVSFSEALRILDLLRQQQQRPSGTEAGDALGPEY